MSISLRKHKRRAAAGMARRTWAVVLAYRDFDVVCNESEPVPLRIYRRGLRVVLRWVMSAPWGCDDPALEPCPRLLQYDFSR